MIFLVTIIECPAPAATSIRIGSLWVWSLVKGILVGTNILCWLSPVPHIPCSFHPHDNSSLSSIRKHEVSINRCCPRDMTDHNTYCLWQCCVQNHKQSIKNYSEAKQANKQ